MLLDPRFVTRVLTTILYSLIGQEFVHLREVIAGRLCETSKEEIETVTSGYSEQIDIVKSRSYFIGIGRMSRLGPKSFPDLLKIFDEENSFKDGWYPDNVKDTWPRGRFNEANSQFGEWYEFELSHAELLDVKLHWNTGFSIPQDGMTVAEALHSQAVRKWIDEDKHKIYPESHIWLASEPLKNTSAEEYGLLKNYEGKLITLDGIHRLLAWADLGKQTTFAFIAGKVVKEL